MASVKYRIQNLLQNRVLQHALFWCLSYYYLLYYFSPDNPQKIDLIYTSVFHLPLLAGVYINLAMLIPWLLRKKRYMAFLFSLIVLIGSMAGLNILLFNKVIDYIFPGYFFISYYGFSELVRFSFIYVGLTTLLKLSRGWFQLLESENRLIRLQQEKADTELLFLKTQINPHFLFNSLNSIYSLSLQKDEKAPATLLKLAEVMRYMIYESDGDVVPLENEINYLKNYIALQQLRNSGKATITFSVNGSPDKLRVAPFMFIVFVENGFKHGVEAGMQEAFIHVDMDIQEEKLQFTVKNNKGIVDETENGSFRGLGLDNVKQRLELLYPRRYQLVIKQDATLYAVQLQLDLSAPETSQ
ncbi:sensor histidine kinase [Chitinophaga sp.]|uniref:sensor histidine kinase n=1 Tax=Chitinophaga sp. TaxID=1869181 RepID=UPI002F952087